MRSCCCTGYLTNPGGVCCMDLPRSRTITVNNTPVPCAPGPLTEEDVRRIIREEVAAALDARVGRSLSSGGQRP